jgi:uncharacterized membrane protein
MERMLVAVFDTESKAYEGLRALHEMDADGTIAVYATTVVAKVPDGLAVVKKRGDLGFASTVTGTTVGALIGLLGGPGGMAIGAAGGSLVGAAVDFDKARVGSDFVAEVAKALAPGKMAVVAEIDEEWTTPVDTRLEALGGQIFRRGLAEVEGDSDERDNAAIRADIAQLKSEHAKAKADRKAKLQAKIDALNARLKDNSDKAKAKHEAIRREMRAKLESLKAKAAEAKHDIRVKHEARMATFKQQYDRWLDGGDLV